MDFPSPWEIHQGAGGNGGSYPGVDLSKTNEYGAAPIHMACQEGRHACIDVWLINGVDPNFPMADKFGSTPAIVASTYGHVKLLALLLDRGADPNLARRDGATAAHAACQHGHVKCLQLLRERNAELSSKDSYGHTPLDVARSCKQPECVDLLLAAGATGMHKEDLPHLREAVKVRSVASFISVSVATHSSYSIVFILCHHPQYTTLLRKR